MEEHENYTTEKIEVKDGNNWVVLIGSNDKYSTLNFWSRNEINSKALAFRKRTKKKLYYQLNDDDFSINSDYCLEEDNIIHIRCKIFTNREVSLSRICVNYAILLDGNPDYTWVTHIRPNKDLVIGDHIFRSPVIIYKKDKFAFALIPDLKTLGNNRPFQTFIDFNLRSTNFKEVKQLSYGFGNYIPFGHVLFKHEPSKEWRIEANADLTFRYYIIIFKEKTTSEILQFINHFFWEKYGKKLLNENLNPQVLPYGKNVEEGFKAIFERHKYWGNFKINNRDCGGVWQRSWAGVKKKPIKFIAPDMLKKHREFNMTEVASSQSEKYKEIHDLIFNLEAIKKFERFTHRHAVVDRIAEIWNNAWFMNIRTGYSFRFFGDFWKDNNLIDKGNKMLNTVLSLPRIKGVFPSVFFPASQDSDIISTINGLKAFNYTDDFHIVDSCLAMYWAFKFYQDFEEREEIAQKSEDLLRLLEEIQLKNGAIPTYINFTPDEKKPIIRDVLINSASSGAPLMFLTEYYKISKNKKIIQMAEKIADYIQKEIIPEDKWHDFEPFFSCSNYPLNTYDDYTKSHIMNNLCIYWCAEGFKELFKITQNQEHLKAGERILAILSLFQQVWNMPYISYNTFGGFGVQNADAELNDARQGLFVRIYMEYYLITGKKEYMERGIATLRACWALQLLRDYEEQCPGNVEGIKTIDGVDKGCVYENYGHTGSDYRVIGYIMPDWGIGTAASATAYVKKHFGDLFIDFKEKLVWGIDGIIAKTFDFEDNSVYISIEMLPNKDYIIVKARQSPENACEIIINNNSIGLKEKEELNRGFIHKIE